MARALDAIRPHHAKRLSCAEAGELPGLSESHFRRLRDAYEEQGEEGLTGRRPGRVSGHGLLRKKALGRMRLSVLALRRRADKASLARLETFDAPSPRMAPHRMARGRKRATKMLTFDLARRHAHRWSRRHGEIALAHRARLRGTEKRTRLGPFRRTKPARLPSSCNPLPHPRTCGDSPLRLPRRETSRLSACPRPRGAADRSRAAH